MGGVHQGLRWWNADGVRDCAAPAAHTLACHAASSEAGSGQPHSPVLQVPCCSPGAFCLSRRLPACGNQQYTRSAFFQRHQRQVSWSHDVTLRESIVMDESSSTRACRPANSGHAIGIHHCVSALHALDDCWCAASCTAWLVNYF